MDKLFEELQHAKDSVRWLLDHESGSVDCHDLVFWAQEVKRLREQIKRVL
jgi:hypothetical protein